MVEDFICEYMYEIFFITLLLPQRNSKNYYQNYRKDDNYFLEYIICNKKASVHIQKLPRNRQMFRRQEFYIEAIQV